MLEDRQGNLWFGGDKGVTVYTRLINMVENHRQGDNITALLEARDGRMWVGTKEDNITSLYEDSQGCIYTGYWEFGKGFDRYDPATGVTRRYVLRGEILPLQDKVYSGDLIGANWYNGFLEDSRGLVYPVEQSDSRNLVFTGRRLLFVYMQPGADWAVLTIQGPDGPERLTIRLEEGRT